MKTHRPPDPFTASKPRPAEEVKGHETTPEEIRATRADAIAQRAAEQKARALELCRGGMSAPDAAREVGAPVTTVKGWCAAAGVELTPGRPGPKPREGAPRTIEFEFGVKKFAAVVQGAEVVLREMRRGGPETIESGRLVEGGLQMRRPLAPGLHDAMEAAVFSADRARRSGTVVMEVKGKRTPVAIEPGDGPADVAQRLKDAIDAAPPGDVAVVSEPLSPKMPEGVELQPVVVRVRPAVAAVEFEPEHPRLAELDAKLAAAAERAGLLRAGLEPAEPEEGTARREQLEAPETPAPRHVEVYVGPPRAEHVEALRTAIGDALKALDIAAESSDWACVRVAVRILGGAS